jgi:hypothetical protein
MECLQSDGASSWHFNAFQQSSCWQASNFYSPRYLASVGKFEEAKEVREIAFALEIILTSLQVLEHVRGNTGPDVEKEFLEVDYPSRIFLKGDADLVNLDLCRC